MGLRRGMRGGEGNVPVARFATVTTTVTDVFCLHGKAGSVRYQQNVIGVRLKKGRQQIGMADWDPYAPHSLCRGGAA